MAPKGFRLILVLILALQSVIAVADVHQLHQRGPTHQALDVGQPSLAVSSLDAGDEDVSAGLQKGTSSSNHACSHCCHCHGSMPYLTGHVPGFDNLSNALNSASFSISFVSWLSTPAFRPPIV